jgi:hypothetical protein
MSLMDPSTAPRVTNPSLPAVTTTDLLKTAALLLILVDHIGHYLIDDWPILRVVGRLGVPIFFFFIGFAKTRAIPLRWLLLGATLTFVEYLWVGALSETQLNILFDFALIRLTLPLVERYVLPSPYRLSLFVIILIVTLPLAALVFEYGGEGWLIALTGLLHRQLADGKAGSVLQRDVVGLIALAVFVIVERNDYSFDWAMTGLLVLGVVSVAGALRAFRRTDSDWQPAARAAAVLRYCGRHSLELYAAQIIGLAALGTVLDLDHGGDEDGDE